MVVCHPCNGKGVLWTVDKWYFTGGFTTDKHGDTVPLVSSKDTHTITCGCCGGLGFVYQAAPLYSSQNLKERSRQGAQDTGLKREEGVPGRDNLNEGSSKGAGLSPAPNFNREEV